MTPCSRARYTGAGVLVHRAEVVLTQSTSRIEAFSDGVFAIAITLLILEIRLPHAGVEGSLWSGLVALWPSYLAFALSFFVILVTWITHHDLMRLIRTANRPVQLANGCTLLYVTFIPFPTAVLAANLGGSEISTAVAFYCGTFVLGSAAFNVLIATLTRGECFHTDVDARIIAGIRRSFRITFSIYVVTTLLALVLPWLALALNVAVRLYLLRVRYQPAPSVPGRV
jgi:uncharacterized membrane protein